MARFGFVSGFYTSESPNVDAEECMNFYPESTEGTAAETALALYPTPGTAVFYGLAGQQCSSLINANGRVFAVVSSITGGPGGTLVEIKADGTGTNRGSITYAPGASSMAFNATQLMVASANHLYLMPLATNVLTDVSGRLAQPNAARVDYLDGSFVVFFQGTNSFQLSALMDGGTWSGLDVSQVEVFPGNIVSILADHRELWVWGGQRSQVYYDSGSTYSPYVPIPGAYIEAGCAALNSPVRMDNSVFWIGEDERGARMAWRASGYLPVRVSTHAVETAWSAYSTVADAISYSYQERGHTFWVIYFPTANATWCYDAATSLWHRRGFWKSSPGVYTAHHSQCHAWAFGTHLVGDWSGAGVLQMSKLIGSDYDASGVAGNYSIRRQRDAAPVAMEKEWILHHRLQIDLEPGLGVQTPPTGGPPPAMGRQAVASLQWSNDAGKTWSSQHDEAIGNPGEYGRRVIWRRLGRSRNRIYRLIVSDPIPWRITDAYLEATPNYTRPTERLSAQMRKMA